MIDITMTATVRPEIIKQTFMSFRNNLLKDKYDYRLIINIDRIGENKKQKEIYKIARNYFSNIVVNFPKVPSFSNAVIWCWSQVTSSYVFHLEDDWKLIYPINMKEMIKILDSNPNLASLRLNKVRMKPNKSPFVYAPKLSLNPTLFKGEYIKNVVKLMDSSRNPEKQLRPFNQENDREKYVAKWRYGIYTKESTNILVVDLGRNWMKKTRFRKKSSFVNWSIK